MNSPDVFIGIDVGARRTITVCAVSPAGQNVWLEACQPAQLEDVLVRIERRTASRRWAIGIDAPRMFPSHPRAWEWRVGGWRGAGGPLAGRHCEVVLGALRLARPGWTPLERNAPRWMHTAVSLFRSCKEAAPPERVHEVHPSASRKQFARLTDLRVPCRGMLKRPRTLKPRDLAELDAFIAAWTAATYEFGLGCSVGGGDGFGTVILPGTMPPDTPAGLLEYPGRREAFVPARYEAAPM